MTDTNKAVTSRRRWPRFIYPILLNRLAVGALIFVSVVPFLYMWLYMGAFWNPQHYYRNVKVAFINADTGFNFTNVPAPLQAAITAGTAGQSMGTVLKNQMTGQTQIPFDWDIINDPNYAYETLYNQIDEGIYQFGIFLPRNLSDNYLTAFDTNNTAHYRPMSLTYLYDQGRDYSTASMVTAPITRLVSSISRGTARKLLLAPDASQIVGRMVPAFWVEPITLMVDIMHPVTYYGQNNSSYLSVMVMYIACIGIVTVTRRFIIGDPVVFGYVNQQTNGDIPLKQVETRDVGTDPVDTANVYDIDAPAESEIDLSDNESDSTGISHMPKGNEKAQPIFSIFHVVTAKYTIMVATVFFCALLIWSVPLSLGDNQYVGAPSVAALFYLVFVGICFLNMLNLFCNLFGLDGFSLPAALFMIFMMTTGGAMLGDMLSPNFFRIGRGLPFHYAVQAIRAERTRRGQHIVRAMKRRRSQMRRHRRKMTAETAEQAEQNV
ncbi:hypothetical protein BDF22DRAFT_733224 [Syncephalis plumigaleata]|nr:hypothetical protein BDF22DRAFT_733224 [Syncephalis plumigaleata]